MLQLDRKRAGWSVGQTLRLGITIREYRARGRARYPNWETFDRICKLYGWPQTFVTVL